MKTLTGLIPTLCLSSRERFYDVFPRKKPSCVPEQVLLAAFSKSAENREGSSGAFSSALKICMKKVRDQAITIPHRHMEL